MTRALLPTNYEAAPNLLTFQPALIMSSTGTGAPSCYRAGTPSNCTVTRDTSILWHDGSSTLAFRNTSTATFQVQIRLDLAGTGGTDISPTIPADTRHIIVPIYFPVLPQADGEVVTAQSLTISFGNNTTNAELDTFTENSGHFRQGWNTIVIPVNTPDTTGLKAGTGGFEHVADTGASGCNFTAGQILKYLLIQFREPTAIGGGFNIGPIQFGRRTRTKILFSFDECTAEMTTVAKPALDLIGANCLCAIPGTIASGAAGYIRAQTLVAAGWEVCNHSTYHLPYTGSQAAGAGSVEADWTQQQATLESYGLLNTFTRKLFVFPENKTNSTVRAIMQSLGVVMARGFRNCWQYTGPHGVDDILELGSHDLNSSFTLAQAKASVDESIRKGTTLMFYGHTLTGSMGTGWAAADFEALVAYVGWKKSLGFVDTPTWQQWYEGLAGARAHI